MSKVIELTDAQFDIIERTAESRGQTPDALLAQLIEELREVRPQRRVYETDDWLRHLGVSDEEIEEIKREIREEAEMPYDADA